MDGEEAGEGGPSMFGEGKPRTILPIDEAVVEKYLVFEEASRCLNTLGKDESGMRYAYLMITATDRKLTNIKAATSFKHLLFVDVSGNYLNLDALQVLVDLPYMVLLKAERNRVESAALLPMPYLQVLNLNKNQILETADVNQPLLDRLELNYNQIYSVWFDEERLPVLKQLEMRGNYLPDLRGSFPHTVECLYLAENRITKIISEDISKLTNLKILHLRDNQIRKLDGFTSYLVNLKYLNLRKNKINKLRQFKKLNNLPSLEVLVVLQNPVAGESEEKVPGEGGGEEDEEEEDKEDVTRIPLLILLPNLKRINKVPVSLEEREEAYESREQRLEEIMAEESSEDEAEPPTTTDLTEFTSEEGAEDSDYLQ